MLFSILTIGYFKLKFREIWSTVGTLSAFSISRFKVWVFQWLESAVVSVSFAEIFALFKPETVTSSLKIFLNSPTRNADTPEWSWMQPEYFSALTAVLQRVQLCDTNVKRKEWVICNSVRGLCLNICLLDADLVLVMSAWFFLHLLYCGVKMTRLLKHIV